MEELDRLKRDKKRLEGHLAHAQAMHHSSVGRNAVGQLAVSVKAPNPNPSPNPNPNPSPNTDVVAERE